MATVQKNASVALVAFFLLAFLAVGVPYWQIPYDRVALPNSILGYGLLVTFLAVGWLRGVLRVPFLKAFVVIGLAAPAAVMLRVVVEASRDPTSHNLWPLELVLTAGVSLVVAFGGALLGSGWFIISKQRGS